MMTKNFPAFDELPSVVPVFPLPGVLLLPKGALPLNIFESRYLEMVKYALSGHRLIAMAQPRDEGGNTTTPSLYGVGCAGYIHQTKKLPDGRMIITLRGLSRCRLGEEVTKETLFRMFKADWSDFRSDYDKTPAWDFDRDRLVATAKDFFAHRKIDSDWNILERSNNETLVTALAMICPFSVPEKQAILEAKDIHHCARILMALLEMSKASTFSHEGSIQ